MECPGSILAYEFLNNSNISDSNEKLIHVRITELSYKAMKEQLRNVFWDLSLPVTLNVSKPTNGGSSSQVVIEPKKVVAFETTDEDAHYSVHYGSHRPAGPGRIFRGHFRSNFC